MSDNIYFCEEKTYNYNNGPSTKYDSFKNNQFVCINCGVMQTINKNFTFSGYCPVKNYDHHLYWYDDKGNLNKERTYYSIKKYDFEINNYDKVAFICMNCKQITLNKINGQGLPLLPTLDNHELKLTKVLKDKNKNYIKDLINEFFYLKKLDHRSAATLLARKILMHFAYEIDFKADKKDSKFIDYVNFIKNSGILGKKWNNKIDKIREIGNEENHEVKVASKEDLNTVASLVEELVRANYLADN